MGQLREQDRPVLNGWPGGESCLSFPRPGGEDAFFSNSIPAFEEQSRQAAASWTSSQLEVTYSCPGAAERGGSECRREPAGVPSAATCHPRASALCRRNVSFRANADRETRLEEEKRPRVFSEMAGKRLQQGQAEGERNRKSTTVEERPERKRQRQEQEEVKPSQMKPEVSNT